MGNQTAMALYHEVGLDLLYQAEYNRDMRYDPPEPRDRSLAAEEEEIAEAQRRELEDED